MFLAEVLEGLVIEVKWNCEGTEINLLNCSKSPKMCNHDRDAEVYCFGNPLSIYYYRYALHGFIYNIQEQILTIAMKEI